VPQALPDGTDRGSPALIALRVARGEEVKKPLHGAFS
jgi:hypothetical protein